MRDAEPAIQFVPIVLTLQQGKRVTVRAIRPDDAERLQSAMRALSDESRYFRFMGALPELPPQLLEIATHPRAGRELQLVAAVGEGSGETIVAGARYSSEAASTDCEFAIAVTDEWQGAGLARRLLELLMQSASKHGFARMEGYILTSNHRMLRLAKRLGFVSVECPEGPTVRKVRCELTRRVRLRSET
jgi:RimJ/RimL family protein N-acetyltransferase